ncbi:MAG: DUF296 domain-containing protein [Candidatus Omnitrophica bacterium]|nr:DUF296 domain-containing protein [Candidatus Omnitrophota bacterium]
MHYTQGRVGRIFILKFNDGDSFVKELAGFARKERIKVASVIFLGALKKGDLVTGPKKPVIPPVPNWVRFKNAWEALGIGTIFTNKSGPQVHVHAAMGKAKKTLTGCVRKDSRVFLVIEAVVFELKGVRASKEIDPETGLNLLRVL